MPGPARKPIKEFWRGAGMSEELRECPFCGSKDVIIRTYIYEEYEEELATCEHCGATALPKLWNTRIADQPQNTPATERGEEG
ncbi:MAG: hypothetical protein C4555_03225 [Dehalococcoidia bacterium]|nr:MAG: hypothetical protein C4555_03225 [Dehalococcoidia bacterium]